MAIDKLDEGAIFANRSKKQANQPDFTGSVVVSEALLRKMVEKAKNKEEVRIRVAGWKNQSKDGKNYLRLKIEEDTYLQGAPRQAPRQDTRGYPRQDNGYTPNGNDRYGMAPPRQPAPVQDYRQASIQEFLPEPDPQGTPPWEM